MKTLQKLTNPLKHSDKKADGQQKYLLISKKEKNMTSFCVWRAIYFAYYFSAARKLTKMVKQGGRGREEGRSKFQVMKSYPLRIEMSTNICIPLVHLNKFRWKRVYDVNLICMVMSLMYSLILMSPHLNLKRNQPTVT